MLRVAIVTFIMLIMHLNAQTARRPVSVLVDRSHEWGFYGDDLADRMLEPAGFKATLCDASLNTSEKSSSYDCLVIIQTQAQAPFSQDEISHLQTYVQNGGGLVVVGRQGTPISKLAEAFGAKFTSQTVSGPLTCSDTFKSWGALPTINSKATTFNGIETRTNFVALVQSDNAPIAVWRKHGKGRVVIWSDDGTYWDFCAQRDKELNVPNVPTTVATIRSVLSLGRIPVKPMAPVGISRRVPAELSKTVGGLKVIYSNPVKNQAEPIIDVLDEIVNYVKSVNQTGLVDDGLKVHLLASAGGGYSGGREIGVQAFGSPGANIAVIGHETTHSYEGPIPGIISEGWASIVGMRITRKLGHIEDCDREKSSWKDIYRKADPKGNRLDVADSKVIEKEFHACEAKMMWMIETLERRFGDDFMARWLKIVRTKHPNKSPSMQECLHYFSLAAKEDLASWYRDLGIGYIRPAN